jgi:hypothetical protein
MRGDKEPDYGDLERELVPTVQRELQERFRQLRDYLLVAPTALPHRDILLRLVDDAFILTEQLLSISSAGASEYFMHWVQDVLATNGYTGVKSENIQRLVAKYGSEARDILMRTSGVDEVS